ncbi:MAG: hypothetical protein COV70_02030 [Parcubacteria group bacterium CG11_big_fil_rev_8_21_14_0_20_39_22]|nr:MAG: hypothetical protein COV70_02030 [Parcubacteria group bacterium CG11_big_fil_rev_8_21_14_0_20_39_22]
MTKTQNSLGERILALISSITLVRHANAPKLTPDQKDENRQLSEIGINQAKKLCDKLDPFGYEIVG